MDLELIVSGAPEPIIMKVTQAEYERWEGEYAICMEEGGKAKVFHFHTGRVVRVDAVVSYLTTPSE